MRSTLFRRAAKLLALAIPALPGAAAAQACGDTLTGSVTLAADLHCSTGWTAFDVGASGITINLNGKTLSGTSALTGINIHGADNVRIVGPGRIRGFWVGANVFRSPKLIVDNIDFEDVGAGVMLNRSYMSTVRRSGFYRIANSAVLIEDPLLGTSMDAPTTSRPVTAPPRKDTASASFRPIVAAWVVRTLARTDTNMPMKPARPDRIAPTAKPAAVSQPSCGTKPITTNRTTPTTAMVTYWRRR